MPDYRQKTLKRPVSFHGVGIHTGEACAVTLHPAEPDSGCQFRLGRTLVGARVESVLRCDRSTCLGSEESQVGTVEHLLAAISSAGLSNLDIEMEGHEIPIMDGSCSAFCEELTRAEVVEQAGQLEPYFLKHPIWVGNESCGVLALPAAEAVYEYALDYPHPLLGYQHCQFRPGVDSFEQDISGARTFALWEEVEPLLARGLARGGDLQNALVVYKDHFSSPLRYPDEPVRHKMLDLVGDLALLGRPLVARVVAVRAGHRWHVELVRRIRQEESMNVG